MSQSQKKFSKKFLILATLAPLIPVLLIAIAFVAIKSDAKNQAEYDRIRAEQAAKIEAKKQQAQLENQTSDQKQIKD